MAELNQSPFVCHVFVLPHLLFPQLLDRLDSTVDEHLSPFGADSAAHHRSAIVGERLVVQIPARHGAPRWNVVAVLLGTGGQLNQERLNGRAAGFNPQAVI